MKGRRRGSDLEGFIDQIKDKQRNTVWPGPLVNSRNADQFLWKGSSNPTVVQRIAALLLGFSFMSAGFGCITLAARGYMVPRVADTRGVWPPRTLDRDQDLSQWLSKAEAAIR